MKTTLIILAATAGCLLAQAQDSSSIDALKAYLNLSDSQVQALQQIQQQDRQANRSTMQKLRQNQANLDDLLHNGGADPTTAGRLLLDIQEQQASLRKSRGQLNAQAAGTLTPDQKAKLVALQNAMQLMPAIHQAASWGLLAMPQDGAAHGGPRRHGPPPTN